MPSSNPLLWPRPPVIWSYGIAVLSVTAALIISRWPALHLQDAPVSLFLCAVMLGAWFGGAGPGLLATALSAFAFYYYFLPPIYSLHAKNRSEAGSNSRKRKRRSEEHTSELQSPCNLVCRLLLEKKKKKKTM